ncbi:MAG: hypothetical protein JW928_08875 [Candidatus Aureabacteria bacterium]|nr:hypothetical protein [Candidatus Auribacterota bacterium]
MGFISPVKTNDEFEQPPEKEPENVKEVYGTEAVHPVREQSEEQRQKGGQKQLQKEKEEAKDHFEELSRAAETAHLTLMENNSPYRFCVYRENENIFIDIVLLNKQGKIDKVIKKNITHEEFHKILQDISLKEGLFFDAKF